MNEQVRTPLPRSGRVLAAVLGAAFAASAVYVALGAGDWLAWTGVAALSLLAGDFLLAAVRGRGAWLADWLWFF